MQNIIEKHYFEWIRSLVINDKFYTSLSYTKLLNRLNEITFIPDNIYDNNRYNDGIEFRYIFGYANGYSNKEIKEKVDIRSCSMLEMMIALAYRIENQIMSDDEFGDRTGQWFWNMIVSLGLGTMSDDKYDEIKVNYILDRFMRKQYSPNGAGGLFTLNNCESDVRNEEIWTQAMWYLDENFDFTL